MSPKKGQAPAGPDMGGITDDWTRLAKMREEEHAQGKTAQQPEAPAPEPQPAVAKRPKQESKEASEGPKMTRRSWYADAEAVAALAAAVDDIHHATRVPKHEVVSELFQAAVAAAPRVEKKLAKK